MAADAKTAMAEAGPRPGFLAWSVADSIPPVQPLCECGQDLTAPALWWPEGGLERAECPACGREQVQAALEPEITHDAFRRIAASRELQALERAMIERNPWYWVVNYLVTEDARAARRGRSVYQRITPYAYARSLVWCVWRWPRLALPKSRQMTVTWLVAGYCLGECQWRSARLDMIQSKKSFDAVQVLQRVGRAYRRQQGFAPWLGPPLERGGESYGTAGGHLRWTNDSQLFALPQGAHHVQSHTPGRLVLDEIQLQEEAAEAYGQALPTEAEIDMIGSAEPSWFWSKLLADRMDQA